MTQTLIAHEEMEKKNAGAGVRKGAWSSEEDLLLRNCIEKYGEGKWHQVPRRAGLNRCRKSCRLRWLNYLRPNIKKGYFTKDEVDLIVRLHKLLGNRWALIAGRLPGRTANDVKNFWNTHIDKKSLGGCKQRETKTITGDNILRPRPQTLTKLQLPGHPGAAQQVTHQCLNEPSLFEGINESHGNDCQHNPSSSTHEGVDDDDECIKWWSRLLEISDRVGELGSILTLSNCNVGTEAPMSSPQPSLDDEHYPNENIIGLSLDEVDVWDT